MDAHQPQDIRPEALDLRLLKFRLRPDRDEPSMLALELVAAGRTHDALEVVDAALTADPEDVDLLLACGTAAMRAGQLPFAQLVLTRAAKQAPSWGEPLAELSRVLLRRDRASRAVEVARRALAIGHDAADLTKLVRDDDARRALDADLCAFDTDQSSVEASLLVQRLLDASRPEHARRVLEAALAGDPDPDLLVLSARLAMDDFDRDLAIARLRSALDLAPDWAEIAVQVGTLLADDGRAEEALPYVERALLQNVDDADLLRLRERLATMIAGPRPDAALDTLFDDRIPEHEDSLRRRASAEDTLRQRHDGEPRPRRTGWLPTLAKRLFGGFTTPARKDGRDIAQA